MKIHLPIPLRRALLAAVAATVLSLPLAGAAELSGSYTKTSPHSAVNETISGYENVLFSGSGSGGLSVGNNSTSAISGNGTVTLSGNSKNSGAGLHVNGSTAQLAITDNAAVKFLGNNCTQYGGGIENQGGGKLDICSNGEVVFQGNRANGSTVWGGAIENWASLLKINENGRVHFIENSSDGSGITYSGAIGNYGNNASFEINGNTEVVFRGNTASTTGSTTSTNGAAIYSPGSNCGFSLNRNGTLLFEDNRLHCKGATASGGAIFHSAANTTLEFKNNGSVRFSNNRAETESGLVQGSTLYNAGTTSKVEFSANTSLSFEGNSATSSSGNVYGGLFNGNGGTLEFIGNGSLTFSGNTLSSASAAALGAAVYNAANCRLVIKGNDSTVFERNTESSQGKWQLRSIYSLGTLVLSADQGKNITFRDSVYSGASATVHFNQQAKDGKGGEIIFSGKNTESDLAAVKNKAATAEEIANSRTSVFESDISLHSGKIVVKDQAQLHVKSITMTAGTASGVQIHGGLVHITGSGGQAFGNAHSLQLAGSSTITGGSITMNAGSTLEFSLDESPAASPMLTLGSTMTLDTGSTILISSAQQVTQGRYRLAAMESAGSLSGWESATLTFADTLAGGQLYWEDNALWLNVAPPLTTATWNKESEHGDWNFNDMNWAQGEHTYQYEDNVDVIFGTIGSGNVNIAQETAPKSVTVENGAGNEFNFVSTDGGRLTGGMSLTKDGEGKLTVSHANDYTGGTVLKNGTLEVRHSEALGSGQVELHGGSLEVHSDTLSADIAAKGNASLVLHSDFKLGGDKHFANEGELVISGTLDVSAKQLHRQDSTYIGVDGENNSSGFYRADAYSVKIVDGGTTSGENAVVRHDALPEHLQLQLDENGTANAGGQVDYSLYHIREGHSAGTSAIHSISQAQGHGNACVRLEGGTLVADTDVQVQATGGQIAVHGQADVSGSLQDTEITAHGGSVSAHISGSSSVAVKGDATLSGNNTHTGGTAVENGTLTAHANALGHGPVEVSSGKLELHADSHSGGISTRHDSTLDFKKKYMVGTGEVIDNTGNLTIIGQLDLSHRLLETTAATHVDVDGGFHSSGFHRTAEFCVQLVEGGITDGRLAELRHDGVGEPMQLGDDGVARAGGQVDYSSYRLNGTDTATASAILRASRQNAGCDATVTQAGGSLTADADVQVQSTGGQVAVLAQADVAGSLQDTEITAHGGSISAHISGNSSVAAKGDVTLTGNNTHTGGTTVENGTLTARTAALGSGDVELAGGKLNMQDQLALGHGQRLGFSGGMVEGDISAGHGSAVCLTQSGSIQGSLALQGGALQLGSHTLAAGKVVVDGETQEADTAMSTKGNIRTGSLHLKSGSLYGASLTVDGETTAEAGSLGCDVSGATLTKQGSGVAELCGTSSFSGGVTVQQGCLRIAEQGTLQADVSVATGAALELNNILEGNVDLGRLATLVTKAADNYTPGRHRLRSAGGTVSGGMYTGRDSTVLLQGEGLAVTGNATLGGGSMVYEAGACLAVDGTLELSQGTALTGDWKTGTTYTIMTASSIANTSGLGLHDFFGLSSSAFTLSGTGTEIRLTRRTIKHAVLAMAGQTGNRMNPVDDAVVATVSDQLVQADWGVVHAARGHRDSFRAARRGIELGRCSIWANGFGTAAHQAGSSGHAGSSSVLYGASMGMEFSKTPRRAAGLAFGHTWNRISMPGADHISQQAQHATLYGRKILCNRENASLGLEAAAGYGMVHSNGHLGKLKAGWGQDVLTLDARLTATRNLAEHTALHAYAGAEYLKTGNGAIYDAYSGAITNLRVEVGLGGSHSLGSATLFAESGFTADMYRKDPVTDLVDPMTGANPGRLGLRFSAGTAYRLGSHWSLNAAYSLEAVKGCTTHSVNAGFGCRF